VLLSESRAPRKLCGVAPLDGFSTARPIVVEDVSKGNIAMAIQDATLWTGSDCDCYALVPIDTPTAANIDCLSPPDTCNLDAVRVYSLYAAKSLQGAAVLCHAKSYWKRKLRAAADLECGSSRRVTD
jgi:uncharacterized Fe-S center protein